MPTIWIKFRRDVKNLTIQDLFRNNTVVEEEECKEKRKEEWKASGKEEDDEEEEEGKKKECEIKNEHYEKNRVIKIEVESDGSSSPPVGRFRIRAGVDKDIIEDIIEVGSGEFLWPPLKRFEFYERVFPNDDNGYEAGKPPSAQDPPSAQE